MSVMNTPAGSLRKRTVILSAIALLVLYAIVPQLGGFKHSWHYLGQADLYNVLGAAGLAGLSYFAAGGTYTLLAIKPVSYGPTVLIQLASMFANRILPAGIGSIGVNFAYLKRQKHTSAQAATVVAVNNGLGFIGHGLVILVALGFYNQSLHWRLAVHSWYWLVMLAAAGVLGCLSFAPRLRRGLQRQLRQIVTSLLSYRHRYHRLLGALATSIALTLCNVLGLWLCAQAVGANVSVAQVLLAFTLGIALGAAAPTPGGLGGVEGGIVAGLVGFHVTASLALAAVLLYRLFNFWLAFIAGAVAFFYASRRRYI
jgi:undecaprenyl-diphosphatase